MSAALRLEVDRHEGCIVDGYSDLLDRSHQEVLVFVLSENRREQANKLVPTDGRAEVEPRAIPCDPYVEIAAKRRVPQMDRR